MKKAKIKATRDYYDTEFDRLIKNGEETVVSLDRAEKITGLNYAVLVETIEEKPEPKKEVEQKESKPTPKKRVTRKKKK